MWIKNKKLNKKNNDEEQIRTIKDLREEGVKKNHDDVFRPKPQGSTRAAQ